MTTLSTYGKPFPLVGELHTGNAVQVCLDCDDDHWNGKETGSYCRGCYRPWCCQKAATRFGLCRKCKEEVLGRPVRCDLDHACTNPECATKTRFCTHEREEGVRYEKPLSYVQKQKVPAEVRDWCRGCLVGRGYAFDHRGKFDLVAMRRRRLTLLFSAMGCDTPLLEAVYHHRTWNKDSLTNTKL